MAWNEITLIIFIGIVISGFIHWFTWSMLVSLIDNKKFPLFYTFGDLHKFTKMNWFGGVMTYLLLLPFIFAFEIGGIVKWLFTVGRK